MEESKPHVVVVPFMGQGHLIPFMELAKLLASQGLAVSYITTTGNAKRLEPEVQGSNLDIRLVSLPMPSIEGLPPGIESSDNVPYHVFEKLMTSSHKLAGPLEEWLEQQMNSEEASHYSPPAISCIIGDIATGWIHRSGDKFGIPIVVFFTTGAFAWSLNHSVFNYTPQKSVERDDELFDVPELSFDLKLRKSDMSPAQRDPDSFPLWAFLTEDINRSKEGRGILINTFYELDSLGIDHIRRLTRKPVWSIGPILSPAVFDDTVIDRRIINSRGKAADIDEEDCLRWLDSRPPQSVVFVCLGSQFILNNNQICALATGLEASGQAFVWAIRRSETEPKTKATEVGLPEGFEERIQERGLIIWGWAPQLLILSHPSIGAFLNHCGWNSTLESVSMGIPMITWPMFADQPYNSKLLEERLGLAIRICVGLNSVPDEEEVRRAVTMLLAEEEGKTMRRKAQELRKHAKMAVNKDGSSFKDLQDFVRGMQQLHQNGDGMPEFEG
jgi:hypothetical protein